MTPRTILPLDHPVEAVVRPPGSKSLSIRALFAAALAEGESALGGVLESGDTRAAISALRGFGVELRPSTAGWLVGGRRGRLSAPTAPIDAGESGLTARIAIAVAALVDGDTTVVGRGRLPQRPMEGLCAALRRLGVDATSTDGGLPVVVGGRGRLPGGVVSLATSETTQFATSLLLAAPVADEALTIEVEGSGALGYLDLTLDVMAAFGGEAGVEGRRVEIAPTGYRATDFEVEPDASAAVYPMVAAAITGGRVVIDGLGAGSKQPDLMIAGALGEMGCSVSSETGSLTVAGPGRLAALDTDLAAAPDGALGLVVACLFAEGESRIRGLGSLRLKESDRLAALEAGIRALGSGARIEGDTLLIEPAPMHGARIATFGDHRLAMSFALTGLVVPGVEIEDPEVVEKTWPGFWDMLSGL